MALKSGQPFWVLCGNAQPILPPLRYLKVNSYTFSSGKALNLIDLTIHR
jgi:hypothetical protein